MNDLLLVLNASKRERRLKIEEKKQKQAEAEKGTRQKRGRSDSSEFAPLASCGAIAVIKDSSLTKRSRGTCRRKHSKSTPVSFFYALFSCAFFMCFFHALFSRTLFTHSFHALFSRAPFLYAAYMRHVTPHAHEKRHRPPVAFPVCLFSSDAGMH